MTNKKQFLVLFFLCVLVAVCVSAFKTIDEQPKPQRPRNLKVLPKDISHDALDSLMDEYNKSLGVKCTFCHAKRADNPLKIDSRSDSNHTKDEARYMITMTNELNAKYFNDLKEDSTKPKSQLVTCMTCHNGKELPLR